VRPPSATKLPVLVSVPEAMVSVPPAASIVPKFVAAMAFNTLLPATASSVPEFTKLSPLMVELLRCSVEPASTVNPAGVPTLWVTLSILTLSSVLAAPPVT